MSDPFGDVGLGGRELDAVVGKFGRSLEAVGPVTAKDSTGAVAVTLDKEGRIASIVVGSQWTSHYSASTLVAGVTEAATIAATTRFEQFGQQFADDEAEPVRTPAPLLHETLSGQLAEIAQAGDAAETAATMEHIGSLLRELTEAIDVVSSQVDAMHAREFTSRSPGGHVKATMTGNGVLVDLTMDRAWLDRAHSTNVGREATQAIHAAYRKIADQDVSAILADSVIGKLDRLSRDPVALARELGLRGER